MSFDNFGRFGRIVGTKGRDQLRRFFRRWNQASSSEKTTARNSDELARIKYELVNVKAALHDAVSKCEMAANLAAERALNRCLMSFVR